MNQLLGFHKKGANIMVCENLFRLYGTSSEEIRSQAVEETLEKAREQYQPQIDKLTSSVNTLTSENNLLISELAKTKQLLAQHRIAY